MRAPEPLGGYSLRFASSANTPLAWTGAGPVSAGQFRRDVGDCLGLLDAEGDVLISCTSRYAFSVALLAAWLSGKSAVLPPNHLRETLRDVRARFAVAHEFDNDWAQALLAAPLRAQQASWDVQLPPATEAVKLFTSGSSGQPKVIVKSLANLLDEAGALGRQFHWPAGAVAGSVPPHHLYGLTFTVLLPWVTGRAWVDAVPLYPGDIRQLLQDTGSRILISIPTQYRALLHDKADMSGILCVSAAAKLPRDHAIHWQQQYGLDILEIYGSTETGVIGFRQQAAGDSWQAFPDVDLSVHDGLLRVRSPFTSEPWHEGFQTADRARLLDDGRFELFGRADSIVKIGGKRISLSKIEHSLLACAGVAEVAVISVRENGRVRDESIWAAVVPRDNCRLSPRELQCSLRDRLEGVEVPRRIVIVDRLPRTASGKLPRAALEALFGIEPTAPCSHSKI
jgi:acyl-coenzyme A synthetase/AMP-(fatty) acid ligase